MKKRVLSLFLALALILSLAPVSALAETTAPTLGDSLAAMETYYQNRLEGEGFAFGTDPTDDWALADLIAAGDTPTVAVKQAFIDYAIGVMAQETVSASDLSRCIITLTALGVDARALTTRSGQALDAAAKLAAMSGTETSIYTTPYMLIALQQFGASYQKEINTLVSSILLAQLSSGGWNGYGSTIDADTTGPVLLALAPYVLASSDIKSAVDKALAEIPGLCDSTGAVKSDYGYGACSTGILLPGAKAAGYDVSSLTAGLLHLYCSNTLPRFQVYEGDSYSDEQGFRGLIAANLASGRLYDFSGNTLSAAAADTYTDCPVTFSMVPSAAAVTLSSSGSTVAPISGNTYDLPEGDYSYTVSLSGYTEKTGTVTVTAAEAAAHTARTVSVSLASSTSQPSGSGTISVKVFVKIPDASDTNYTDTYRHNSANYEALASQSVTLSSGATVFDALDAALSAAGISYVEKSSGYISKIGNLSELDHGTNSGWMFMVNGTNASVSCRDFTLTSNATVIWYYTDDYTKESGSESWSSSSGSSTAVPTTTNTGDPTAEGGSTGGQAAEVPTFSDVPAAAWYADAVACITEMDLFKGTSSTTFSPDRTMTRAMLVTVLYHLAGSPTGSATSDFSDIPDGSDCLNAVSWAKSNGLVNGISANLFDPDAPISREQTAAILFRYAKTAGYDTTQGGMQIREYSDYTGISSYASEAMTWAVNAGLFQGRSDGTLDPAGEITRAELAAVLTRFVEAYKQQPSQAAA